MESPSSGIDGNPAVSQRATIKMKIIETIIEQTSDRRLLKLLYFAWWREFFKVEN